MFKYSSRGCFKSEGQSSDLHKHQKDGNNSRVLEHQQAASYKKSRYMAEQDHISAEELVDLMITKWNNQPKASNFNAKDVHIKTLDDLVNVNSLFTLAVFVGLSQAVPDARSLDGRDNCNAGPGIGKMLVLYEVTAFACFLLSSLIAKVLKLHLSLDGQYYDFISRRFDMKDFLLIVTATASVSGIVLLTLSVVNIVQIRIGVYSCGSAESRQAIWALCLIVGIALVVYVVSLSVAIFASIKGDELYDEFPTRRFMPENTIPVPPSPVEGIAQGGNAIVMSDFGVEFIV